MLCRARARARASARAMGSFVSVHSQGLGVMEYRSIGVFGVFGVFKYLLLCCCCYCYCAVAVTVLLLLLWTNKIIHGTTVFDQREK